MALENISLPDLQAALARAGARWQPRVTLLSELPASEKRRRLGAMPPGGEQELLAREQAGRAHAQAHSAAEVRAVGYPATFDWRNVGGNNYVPPVEDQGGCGSCVAFGTVATMEALVRITRNDPNYPVDLSEAQLFYCYGASQGATCEAGWWPDQACDDLKNGIVDAACFPYTAGDQGCNLCADWQNRLTSVTGWHHVTSTDDMKNWLSTTGPLDTCFSVYNDFFSYSGGIYSHVSGDLAGGHCVSVVGYDDVNGCWICKNSWGAGWGESGFFRIAYGQCGIDSQMWALEGIVATGWERGTTITGLWTIDQDQNAWAFVRASDGSNLGWRKIASDSDNICIDMLVELAAAKAAGRTVDFYENQGVITQVYIW